MGVLANTRSPVRVCQFRLPAGVLRDDSSSRGRFVKEHKPLKISPLSCAASAATVRGGSANVGLDCWCARPCGELSDRFPLIPFSIFPPHHNFANSRFIFRFSLLFPNRVHITIISAFDLHITSSVLRPASPHPDLYTTVLRLHIAIS